MRRKRFKRLTAFALSALMLLQTLEIPVLAQDMGDGISEFNFSTSRYVISEADGDYEITVNRRGDLSQEAYVMFKAIDAISVYEEDYLILDEEGNPLEKTEGMVVPINLQTRMPLK